MQVNQSLIISKMLQLGVKACEYARETIMMNVSNPADQKDKTPQELRKYEQEANRWRDQSTFWDSCHEKHSTEFKENVYDIFIDWTNKIEKTGKGSCDEYSLLVMRYLLDAISKDENLSMLDAEFVEMEDEDHVFVRLFVKSQSQEETPWFEDKKALERSVIIDAWVNKKEEVENKEVKSVFPATEMTRYLRYPVDKDKQGRLIFKNYDRKVTLTDSELTVSLLQQSAHSLIQKMDSKQKGSSL